MWQLKYSNSWKDLFCVSLCLTALLLLRSICCNISAIIRNLNIGALISLFQLCLWVLSAQCLDFCLACGLNATLVWRTLTYCTLGLRGAKNNAKIKISQKYHNKNWNDSDHCESNLSSIRSYAIIIKCCYAILLLQYNLFCHMSNRNSTDIIAELTNLFESQSQPGLDTFLRLFVCVWSSGLFWTGVIFKNDI